MERILLGDYFRFSERSQALLALHFATFLWGFTAIIAKFISYGSLELVWHRMTITSLVYWMLPQTYHYLMLLTKFQIVTYFMIGLIVCTHFLAFYSSVKFGNSASITLACAGSVSFFSSVFEPFILKTAYSIRDIGLGLLVLVGILFIYISLPKAASNDLTNRYDLAIASGIISSILAALFTVLNKKYATLASPLVVSAIEMSAGAIFLSVLVPSVYQSKTIWFPSIDISHASEPGSLDLIWILILSILCTNLTFYLSMNSLNYVSGFTATLIFNLEPVYGIILGALIFDENKHLNASFYIGTCIILLSIFINPLLALLYADECGDDREKSQGMIISLQRGLMKVRKEYVQVNVNDDDRDCEKFHQRQSSSRMEVEATI